MKTDKELIKLAEKAVKIKKYFDKITNRIMKLEKERYIPDTTRNDYYLEISFFAFDNRKSDNYIMEILASWPSDIKYYKEDLDTYDRTLITKETFMNNLRKAEKES